MLVEPGIYRTPIFDRLVTPADGQRLASYDPAAAYVDKVLGTFKAAISAPDAPGSDEVAETFVRLVEMAPCRTAIPHSRESSDSAAARALQRRC